ncbi:MAG: hypothetical protein AAB420_00250 [Patescibacteria group bacterium]
MAREKPKIKAGTVELGEMLGHGLEKAVYENKNNPDQIIGIYLKGWKRKPEVTKARYYLTNILHMLYPKWFYTIHQVGHEQLYKKGTQKTANYFIADKMVLGEDHKRMEELGYLGDENEKKEIDKRLRSDPQYLDFIQEMERIGMMVGHTTPGGVESTTGNFSKDPEGNLQYVDTIDPFFDHGRLVWDELELAFSPIKLKTRIMEKLSGHEQVQALAYLDRILVLKNELQEKLIQEKQKQEIEVNRRNQKNLEEVRKMRKPKK